MEYDRLRCCICGEDTADAADYVQIAVRRSPEGPEVQYFGAHPEHLQSVLAKGFDVWD
ncbi:hypothetical protein Acsp05_65100 [Actinokineospora sp. NBRC 105648]|nr:hypothetical protein Acsp05_65100 [Actinokineospora sp. NBRC 105648]